MVGKKKFLSRVGKEIIIKSVTQEIPSYCISIFLLPKTLCDELQRMMNSFLWGTKKNGRRYYMEIMEKNFVVGRKIKDCVLDNYTTSILHFLVNMVGT